VSIFEFLQQALMSLFGTGLAIGLFVFVYWRNAARWRLLARHYARDWGRPSETRKMQNGVMYGQGA